MRKPITNMYLPNPSARAGWDLGQYIFKQSLSGLNSGFSFS